MRDRLWCGATKEATVRPICGGASLPFSLLWAHPFPHLPRTRWRQWMEPHFLKNFLFSFFRGRTSATANQSDSGRREECRCCHFVWRFSEWFQRFATLGLFLMIASHLLLPNFVKMPQRCCQFFNHHRQRCTDSCDSFCERWKHVHRSELPTKTFQCPGTDPDSWRRRGLLLWRDHNRWERERVQGLSWRSSTTLSRAATIAGDSSSAWNGSTVKMVAGDSGQRSNWRRTPQRLIGRVFYWHGSVLEYLIAVEFKIDASKKKKIIPFPEWKRSLVLVKKIKHRRRTGGAASAAPSDGRNGNRLLRPRPARGSAGRRRRPANAEGKARRHRLPSLRTQWCHRLGPSLRTPHSYRPSGPLLCDVASALNTWLESRSKQGIKATETFASF